jgi:glutaredoxin 3
MIIIYVIEGCPYCEKALRVLNGNNIKHKKIVAHTEEEKKLYKKKNQMNTFPQIFIHQPKTESIKIGGCDDFMMTLSICNSMKNSGLTLEAILHMYQILYKKK